MGLHEPYPWYESEWLTAYARACAIVQRSNPGRLAEFRHAFDLFRVRPDFAVTRHSGIFDDDTLDELRRTLAATRVHELEKHECETFGRFVMHGHDLVTRLHHGLVEFASELAGEALVPTYNFVSLYRKNGRCAVHLDTPFAKWTIDLCLRQSEPWPIHISRVVDWPSPGTIGGDDWESTVKESGDLAFESYPMEPGEAIFFGGTSQWHYRDLQPDSSGKPFCDLVFFHFMPVGAEVLIYPQNWAQWFGVPELAVFV